MASMRHSSTISAELDPSLAESPALPAGIAEIVFLPWLNVRGAKGESRPMDTGTLAPAAGAG
jgi:hypothetical protein